MFGTGHLLGCTRKVKNEQVKPGVNVTKLSFFIADATEKETGDFVPGKNFQPSPIFSDKPPTVNLFIIRLFICKS